MWLVGVEEIPSGTSTSEALLSTVSHPSMAKVLANSIGHPDATHSLKMCICK